VGIVCRKKLKWYGRRRPLPLRAFGAALSRIDRLESRLKTAAKILYWYWKFIMPLVKENPYYTYADYLAWDENERYEIIDGDAQPDSPGDQRSLICRDI
jgi:hypothetical protein